jgi:hypothetical protein
MTASSSLPPKRVNAVKVVVSHGGTVLGTGRCLKLGKFITEPVHEQLDDPTSKIVKQPQLRADATE